MALNELLSNPGSVTKARAELARVNGGNKKVEESDVNNLPFLQAVVRETLRLHPPVPLHVRRAICTGDHFHGI